MDTKYLGLIVFFLIISVIASFMFLPLFEYKVETQESKKTDGVVTSTDIETIQNDDSTKYRPVIEYQYLVNSETYTSDNLYPPSSKNYEFNNRRDAQEVLGDYQQGSEITVNYRPQDPSSAYLEENSSVYKTWMIASIIYAIISILMGVWLIKVGFKRWRQRRWISDTPTEEIESVAIGPTEIKGDIQAKKDPMKAPFTEDECVYYEYEIKEYKEDHGSDDDDHWETIDSGSSHIPFELDDGTGKMLVEPHEDTVYEVKDEDEEVFKFSSSSETPERITEFVNNSNISDSNNRRKYRQKIIKNEDTGYIFGTAQIRDDVEDTADNSDRLCIKKVTDGSLSEPLFMVSSAGEDEVINRRSFALWRVPFGGLILVVAVFILLIVSTFYLGIKAPVLV